MVQTILDSIVNDTAKPELSDELKAELDPVTSYHALRYAKPACRGELKQNQDDLITLSAAA